MSASLVGSEMCIRDRPRPALSMLPSRGARVALSFTCACCVRSPFKYGCVWSAAYLWARSSPSASQHFTPMPCLLAAYRMPPLAPTCAAAMTPHCRSMSVASRCLKRGKLSGCKTS
eukprot:7220417-Alexandrium_andersonii.AAC.1